jgi:uncharacterized protein
MSQMFVSHLRAAAFALALAAFGGVAFGGVAQAQQPAPTPAAIALAREILILKGASEMWDPIIPNTISRARNMFLQTNINLAKDITEIADQLRAEYAPRAAELSNEVAAAYAARFTEPELKELLAFYKSPIGRKAIAEEPQVIDASAARMLEWGGKFSEEIIVKMRTEMKKRGHDL